MKLTRLSICIICLLLSIGSAYAQITERVRPIEWERLILGGRYMDRFKPMPDGELKTNVWGAQDVIPRFVDNGIEDPKISFWGGNILKGDDGLYHLYVCGWAENSPKGHMFWPNSTVYHTTSKSLHGPYKIIEEVGKGHNPEAFMLADGRVVIYVIDGYYISDDMNGPWSYNHFEFDQRDRRIIEGLSNLTFATRQDGSKLMICRGGGVWISKDGISPYQQISDKRVYPDVDGRFEDPVVWRDELQYHLIVNDWLGRIAYYQRSKDGINWITEAGEAYTPDISFHSDGKQEKWFKYERAKVFQDEYGRVEQMNFAVIDTIKWNDLPNDNHSSKNICIPMNKGLRISVMNKLPISEYTQQIALLVKAEEGFNPQTDLDLGSLRFGSHNKVNFGYGSRVISVHPQKKDLIIMFDAHGCGITEEEWAPKLIGKKKSGEMIYGYAKLSYVDYNPAILSALKPQFKNGYIHLKVQNFGLSASKGCDIMLSANGKLLGKAKLSAIKPYGEKIVVFEGSFTEESLKGEIEILYQRRGKTFAKNTLN